MSYTSNQWIRYQRNDSNSLGLLARASVPIMNKSQELCAASEPKDFPMPTPRLSPAELERVRQAISTAKEINGMLQGTMGLEGQGLDGKTLRNLKRDTLADLLGSNSA